LLDDDYLQNNMTINVSLIMVHPKNNIVVDKSVIMAEEDSLVRSIFKSLYKEELLKIKSF
jgi:hypothetical protein